LPQALNPRASVAVKTIFIYLLNILILSPVF